MFYVLNKKNEASFAFTVYIQCFVIDDKCIHLRALQTVSNKN